MRILITGGAGFIGSAVVRRAVNEGHEVICFDALTYASCLENLSSVASDPLYNFTHGDITDRSALTHTFAQHRPDAVIHLAAESHVDRSIVGPELFVQTNIVGTFQLLEAACAAWNKADRPSGFRFLHVSTDEVYGELTAQNAEPFHEKTRYDPQSPYAASKAASDHLVRAWGATYGLPVIVTNCSNNFGPFQFPEKLVPVVIIKAISGEPIPVYGTGQNVRDWLYVEDHADALLCAVENGAIGETYNIGAQNERRNIELVAEICRILDDLHPKKDGSYTNQITYVEDRPGHDLRYAVDPRHIHRALGWAPKLPFSERLQQTVQWYLDHGDWWRKLKDREGANARLGLLK